MSDDVAHLELASRISGVSVDEFVLPARGHVVVDGMRLHYLDWRRSDQAPVVFLHGGGLTAHTWDLICAALQHDHRCVALDQRGHGDSEWSPNLDYTLDALLGDLKGFIEQLDLRRPVLVGHSIGGVNAMRYASRHPDGLAGLVLVDIGPHVDRGQLGSVMRFMMGPADFGSIDEVVERAIAFNPKRDAQLLRYSVQHNLRRLLNGRWTWKRDSRHLSPEWFDDLATQFESLEDEATAVRCPVLIVRGEESAFSPDKASAFAARFRDAGWVSVPGAGHTVQGDNPAGLLAVLRPFLSEAAAG